MFSQVQRQHLNSHMIYSPFAKWGSRTWKILYSTASSDSSSAAPVRKHRLLTMAPAKIGKRRISLKEKEQKRVTKCLRRRLAWCNSTGRSYDSSQEQYSLLPRALADCDGNPNKGSKATWTKKLSDRYSSVSQCSQTIFRRDGCLMQL